MRRRNERRAPTKHAKHVQYILLHGLIAADELKGCVQRVAALQVGLPMLIHRACILLDHPTDKLTKCNALPTSKAKERTNAGLNGERLAIFHRGS